MDFSIAVLYPTDSPYWRCFEDIIYPLRDTLIAIGYSVEILHNRLSKDAVNIILGLQDVPDFPLESIPENSILYNFEQIIKGSKALRPHYIESLCKLTVWDYSERNIDLLRRNFEVTNGYHVPLRYTPQMTCLNEDYPKDIDVLFYGFMNPRRQRIILELRKRGVNVVAIENVFGHKRNLYIARSKLILNMHYYTPGIFEEVRISFLLANKKTIVCERNDDTSVPPEFEESCFFAPYNSLVDTVVYLLENNNEAVEQGAQGYLSYIKQRYEDVIAKVAKNAVRKPSGIQSVPAYLNAGSGKDFKEEYLNLDINPAWNPDIVLDLSSPINSEKMHKTWRFGDICLSEGYFDEIIANDVLEHVPDVICTMTNFLRLLSTGGKLIVQVPYDLSYGAWQDPTHVRAFNEMSFRYYTDWSWYVGWRDYHFLLKDISYSPSDLGKRMYKQQNDLENILHTPRAIESMTVTLEKCQSSHEARIEYDLRHRTFYKRI